MKGKYALNVFFFAAFLSFLSMSPVSQEIDPARTPYPVLIEKIIASGRLFSVVVAFCWILFNIRDMTVAVRQRTPTVPFLVFGSHLFLSLKLLYFGFDQDAVASAAILFFQIFLVLKLVNFLILRHGLDFLVHTVSCVAAGLVVSNIYLMNSFPDSATVHGGSRLTGTAANPQHLMLILALLVPPLMAGALDRSQASVRRVVLVILTAGVAYLLLRTGSRTGLGAVILNCFICGVIWVKRGGVSSLLVAMAAILGLIAVTFLANISLSSSLTFFTNRGDTRSHVWISEFQRFADYPVWGVPPDDGGAFYFSEMLWLSMLANGGIVVGFLLVLILFSIVRTAIKSLKVRGKDKRYGSTALLLLATVVLLSLTEAVFAGRFTAFAFLSFVYFGFASFRASEKVRVL